MVFWAVTRTVQYQ